MSEHLTLETDADGIATLTLDVRDRPMNVMNPGVMADLSAAIDEIATSDAIKGVIVTSAKKDFMAGADLKWLESELARGMSALEALELVKPAQQAFRRLESCGKPVVAAVNGTALGGGLELALACHHRIVADDSNIRLGLPEVTVGLLPGAGGTQRLPRLIGIEKALPLMLEGTHVRPGKALELGIVNAVVPAASLLAAAREWLASGPDGIQPWDQKGFKVPGGAGAMHPRAAQTFMGGTAMVAARAQHNYPAPIAILSCVYEGTIVPIDTGLKIEGRYFAELVAGPVARNMVRTLFVNKGEADRGARRPTGVPRRKVERLGVLGAGMMGAGIAYVSARAGIDVVLIDTSQEHAERGRAHAAGLLEKAVARGRMAQAEAEAILGRITATTDYGQLKGANLVVEAVFEDRTVKAGVTALAEAELGADAIFATNTSTLPITGLATASSRPAQFIGIHFFSPVDKMPLVEIIVGEQTEAAAIATSLDFVQQLRKTPIVVNDSRGFFTSRVFSTFTNEGMTMLGEGINPALIENAAKFSSMPVGPLAVLDEVSLELAYQVTRQTREDLGGAYEETSGWPVLKRMVEELERKGKRFGEGFYDYPADGPKHLWKGLAQAFPEAHQQPSLDEVKQRLLWRQAIEAARCVEERVVTEAADADIGAILGIGFPPWTGGPLSFIDTVGIAEFVDGCKALAEKHGPRFAPSDWLSERAANDTPFYA